MGWKDIPDSGQADRIPGGVHMVHFIRAIRKKKDGTEFSSKAGDAQLMLVAADDQDREAAVMVTLSAKAAWKLKGYLVAVGADLDAMDADGVDWNHFKDELFAQTQLNDRPFKAEIRWEKGNDGKEYADILPLRRPADEPAASAKVDEIPI